PIAKDFAPRFSEHPCGSGVMRAIDNCARIPHLKTSGPVDTDKSARNRFVRDVDLCRMNRRDCQGGVLLLMLTAQRDWRLVIKISDKLQRRSALGGAHANHFSGIGLLWGRNNGDSRFYNPGFFSGDFSKRVSKPFLVIEGDWRND